MTDQPTESPALQWEFGTAYELFISLYVLHMPDEFAIRASWASGVRARIPASERKLLEEVVPFIGFPLGWVHDLPGEKDAISALWALKQIPAAERLPRLLRLECGNSDWEKLLMDIHQRRAWDQKDMQAFKDLAKKGKEEMFKEAKMARFLDRWVKPEELGEGYLSALNAYYQAFFEEEEKRVSTVLKEGLEHARALASQMSIEELVKELSQGVQSGEILKSKTLIFLPAFWTTPLILLLPAGKDATLFFFGARPADMAAIPGEMVPDGLLRGLKALADPTRLKIMYYLTQEELTPSELARRLQLRAPTVTHHLGELRLSGLVNVKFQGQEKLYRARSESLEALYATMNDFLQTRKSGA